MNQKLLKLTTGFASAALMLSFAPTAFGATTTVTISGNGVGSINTVNIGFKKHKTVTQTNLLSVEMIQSSLGNSGGNTISGTTTSLSDPSITTGNVTLKNESTVKGGSNIHVPDPCDCQDPSTVTVNVKDNGANSHNTVTYSSESTKTVTQTSSIGVGISQELTGNSGENSITDSTGGGIVTIHTGDVSGTNTSTVEAGSNVSGPAI